MISCISGTKGMNKLVSRKIWSSHEIYFALFFADGWRWKDPNGEGEDISHTATLPLYVQTAKIKLRHLRQIFEMSNLCAHFGQTFWS